MARAGAKKSGNSGAAGGGSESLGRQVYGVLRRALRDGLIQPGRYYSELEFAEMLGVSRTPVREALKALEMEGVLEAAPHRGYRLRTFGSEEINEIVVLRRALERISLTELIKHGSDADIERLAQILRRQKKDKEGKEMFALDEEFHLSIAELARLGRTRDILSGLRSAAAVVSAGASVPLDETRHRIDEHYGILAAIEARDLRTATRLMDKHIDSAMQALLAAAASGRAIQPLRGNGALASS